MKKTDTQKIKSLPKTMQKLPAEKLKVYVSYDLTNIEVDLGDPDVDCLHCSGINLR